MKNIINNKKKSGKYNKIGTGLIIAGILLITIPLIGTIRHNIEQRKVIEDFNKQIQKDQYEELVASLDWGSRQENANEISVSADNVVTNADEIIQELELNQEDVESEGLIGENETRVVDEGESTEINEASVEVVRPITIALIEIPSINVILPIAEGVDLFTLKYCVGYMPGTGRFGMVGNAVLAGHRGYTYGTYFNQLDEVKVGDLIKITTSDGSVYDYSVYDSLIVEPDDTSILQQSDDEKIITLITCHPKVVSTSRLIVKARLNE